MSSEAAVILLRIQCRAQQRYAIGFCQLTNAPLNEGSVAGDRQGFVGGEWQPGCAIAGLQCPLSVFAGLIMSYRSSWEFVQTHTSAKIRAQGWDQMLHVLPRYAGRLYNWRPLTQNLSVIGFSFSSWKLALFKNSLVAFIVFCDIIDSPTCFSLSSDLIMKLLLNNHQLFIQILSACLKVLSKSAPYLPERQPKYFWAPENGDNLHQMAET